MMLLSENKAHHSQKVAEFMTELAPILGISEETAYFTGLNHDIGYLFGKENHARNGARFLEFHGVHTDIINAIKYHGTTPEDYMEKKEGEPPALLICLWIADLSVDYRGNIVGFDARLNSIKEKYGEDSKEYRKAKEIISYCSEYLENIEKNRH